MSRFVAACCLSLLACTDRLGGPVAGPFTGETHRFVIDSIEVPTTLDQVRAAAKDLDGDESVENKLGVMISSLHSYGDAQEHPSELVASRAIASTIEIQADDLEDDATVGVTFRGRDGAPARTIGGRLVDGRFLPNELRTTDGTLTGAGLLLIPVFADVDALEIEAATLELDLVPVDDGYDVVIRGGVRMEQLLEAIHAAIEDQILSYPEDHRSMWTLADKNVDGVISDEEMSTSLLATFLDPDVELSVDGAEEKLVSFGFRMHARQCASGVCLDASVTRTCFDRVRNGDETDVDCGGSCAIACAGGRACIATEDCQSRACDAGTCAPVSCTDGVKNGLEASLDCGGACAMKCGGGAVCGYDFDCASNNCTATTATGVCQ